MREHIFISTFLLACATGDDPDATRPIGERIVGGTEDYLEDSVGMLSINCPTLGGGCSSTLIGSETVLTAAHCVHNPELKISPQECSYRFQGPGTASLAVGRVDIHPRWTGPYGDFNTHDLAVVHLEGVAFGAHTEVLTGVGPFVGDTIEIVGYGRAVPSDPSSGGVLRSATTSVSEAGNESFSYRLDAGASSCSGDSGGPSFQRVHETGERRLVGVHSSAADASCQESFDTRVGGHLEWVISAAGDDLGCGGVDYTGYCAGSWVVWCDNGSLHTSDCSRDARYSTCGYVDDATGHYCVEPAP
jgi:V8-like Glu-specific endopeptidase